MRSWLLAVGLCAAAAVAVAGCSSNSTAGTGSIVVSGNTLSVYASQPPGGSGGQVATDTLDAERLALQQAGGKAGPYRVTLKVLDGRLLSDNARSAIEDSTSIAYLGELQPGTSQISVEILNQQGLLEVSPADTAAYLTQPVLPVSSSPTSYYPAHSTYKETFARVVPNSGAEARALVTQMQAEHVSKLYVASDGSAYGATLAIEVRRAATAAGLSLSSGESGADGALYGATVVSPSARAKAAQAIDQLASASPTVKLFAPSGLYSDAFVAGLNAGAQQRLVVSSPGFMTGNLPPAGQKFVSDFKASYGHAPAPQAIFGYEAMSALLAVLVGQGKNANNRGDVVAAYRSLKNRNSAIGTYSINGGDPTIAPFIFARVRGGQLVPFKFVQSQG